MSQSKLRVVVFASCGFAQPLIAFLAQQKVLAGIVFPDPYERASLAPQITAMMSQLQQANIPFLCSCESKLSSITPYLKEWQADLGMIATYPHILPKEILAYFSDNQRYGIFNLHASDLPDYRGPQPLYWQIREARSSTCLVIHHAEEKVDSGRIVAKRDIPIDPLDTLPCLTNRVAFEAATLVEEFLSDIGTTKAVPKGEEQLPKEMNKCCPQYFARRPSREELFIDFENLHAHQINAMCRAGNGSEFMACIYVKGVPINVLQSSFVDRNGYGTKPGTIILIGEPEGLIISVKDSALRLDILAGSDGVYSGLDFAERFQLDAGMCLTPVSSPFRKSA